MYSQVALRSKFRFTLALLLVALLLPLPSVSLLVSALGQGQSPQNNDRARPHPGKPEGELPNLDDVQNESQLEREAPPPIHSTVRSPKNSGKSWNGKRVGDPPGEEKLDQPELRAQVQRAHARRRAPAPPPISDDQYVQNFFTWAVLRSPSSAELTFWNDQFRVAYAQGQTSVKLVTIALGKTLFESAEYLNRNRDNHWHVYDLYKTYLMRDPDPSGWSTWENLINTIGYESVRRGFEESGEIAGLLATISPNGSPTSNAASLITARVDPRNQPANGMLARDATWSVPLLSLPGRNGLDLGLALSYSSMVWTRSGPYIHFDEDNGFPSPGFRLGFPVVQRKTFNAQTAKNAYLLVTSGGQRVELRQVGSSNIYEAGDSSYLQLTDNGGNLLVRSTDGTQLTFVEFNNEFSCTQVKDRNGNYITISRNGLGRITTITDTLNRVINFNYDSNANLISITQAWNGQPAHQWASFGWGTRNMQSSFSNVGVVAPKNGTALPVITQVVVNDTSYFTFDYTNSLQVSVVRNYFGAVERNARTFTYETPASDVPRLLDSRISAQNWTGVNGVPSQVITQYSVAGDGACVMTAPDGTIYKEYYGTGWQKGLTTASEVWSGGVKQKWTTTAWTQDNTSVSYETNPRVTETNVYDVGGNRRRKVIDYGPYAQYGLPYGIREYAADGVTEIRQTFTDYNLSQAYLDRRIIGLVSAVHLTNVSSWQGKVTYEYDDPARLQAVPVAATQHDTTYNTSFTARGNVTAVTRWDATDIVNASKRLITYTNYYNTGTPISTTDPSGHQSTVSYTDSFSDGLNRNTFAYATTITDADGGSSTRQYNYHFAATTRTQSPTPAGQSQGLIQTMSYNSLGQLERITTSNTGAYRRFWYGADYTASYATVSSVADQAYSIQVTDGLGREIGGASNHPGSNGGYRLISTIYDQMGRPWKVSNPTEVNNSWVPSGDDASGIYYTQQTYDWNGRPLITTNPDGTTKQLSYAGCGCAGGQVMTLTDEGTVDAGVTKRRQQRIYSDVLGRTVKSEILNWQSGSVYSATVSTYNARDQVEQITQYAGAEGSGTNQTTTMSYDGYGRLKTKRVPEEATGTNKTWNYNIDGTLSSIVDARGAATTFGYAGTNRGLVKSISHTLTGSPTINVSFNYDAVGNRTSMTDATGTTNYSYNQLSQLTSESRTFTGLGGSYALNYAYNLAGQLSSLSIPFEAKQMGYNYDAAGRLSGVTGSGFSTSYYDWQTQQYYTQSVPTFLSNVLYRAWGSKKSMTYGNTVSDAVTYNSRLQPLNYSVSNIRYIIPPTTHTSMSWNYQYYNDGRLRFAADVLENKWDRFYAYDHAGRLKEAATNRIARGQSWDFWNPDPYHQAITYDAFDHVVNRAGRLYRGYPSDSASYTNNRRSGWTYDAAGNVLNDQSYTHTFDAAGRDVQVISQANAGDGSQNFPFQPVTEITQNYDGDGNPNKRVQLTRMNWYDEFDPEQPLIQVGEDSQTSYYLRSSVLDGRAIAELVDNGTGGAMSKQVNIYAGDLKIACDRWGSVEYEHHIPSTGSWIVTHGHTSRRDARRQERDPTGAELPMSDPYASQYSYPSMKFAQPMFIDGGDPFDYRSGISVDGIPVSQAQLARMLDTGVVQAGVFVGGRHVGNIDLSGQGIFGVPTTISTRIDFWERLNSDNSLNSSTAQDREDPDMDIETASTTHSQRWLGAVILNFSFPGLQVMNHHGQATEMDKLIKRAEDLRDAPNRNDCKALVALISYAGDLYEDVGAAMNALSAAVGGGVGAVLVARKVLGSVTGRHEAPQPRVGDFGSHGFLAPYRDFGSSPNQVRHAVGALMSGMIRGTEKGLSTMNSNETDPNADGAADVRLNGAAVPLGGELTQHVSADGGFRTERGRKRMHQLASDFDNKICDPNVR